MFCNVNYEMFKQLLKVFNNLETIYKISKVKFLFKQYLLENKVFIPENIYSKLTNPSLKEKCENFYNKLQKYGVDLLTYDNNKFNDIFFCFKKYELVIFSIGNTDLLLKNDKIMIYKNEINSSEYSNNIEGYINKKIMEKFKVQIKIIEKLEDIELMRENEICILNFKIDKYTLEYINNIDLTDKLILFCPYNFNIRNENLSKILASSILNKLIVLEARYEEKNVKFIDFVLECGKEIFVVPGDIMSGNCYFSNYLIKLGANTILSKSDINDII